MADLMLRSDAAVISAGGTLWELLYCGCATLSYSRNSLQRDLISNLAQRHIVRNLGYADDFSPDGLMSNLLETLTSWTLRARMRVAGQSIVDGVGAARVVEKMTKGLSQ
jgi:spore coat polysaccharide biosynthesis predicted glycosyltransferase SpsG